LERRSIEVKVLWSNLYRGVRTYFIAYRRPKESFFSYRLLATLSKRSKDLSSIKDSSMKLLLKVRTFRSPTEGEVAFTLVPLSLNILGKYVMRNPGYGIYASAIKGFKRFIPISHTLTLSKNSYLERVRPLLISLNPEVPVQRIKSGAKAVLTRLWRSTIRELAQVDPKYLELKYVDFLSPLSVVVLTTSSEGVDEIKAVISDGGELKEIRLPVRRPVWELKDLPPKIMEDIETSIIRPVRKGLPFATRGAIITGPPGVGKSVMAEALSNALGLKVVELRPQNYRSMWYGTTEKMLNAIFKQIIRKRHHLALIIDDAEFISSRKYTVHEAHVSEISTILYHLQRPDRPFTILTANNPELIDPAILRPGRIDVTIVIGYPDRVMRRKAIVRNSERYRIRFKDEALIDKLVDLSKWFTLAEVDAFLRLAASRGDGLVSEEEVQWAKRKFNVSISERISMQDYLRWWSRKTQGIVITYIPPQSEI